MKALLYTILTILIFSCSSKKNTIVCKNEVKIQKISKAYQKPYHYKSLSQKKINKIEKRKVGNGKIVKKENAKNDLVKHLIAKDKFTTIEKSKLKKKKFNFKSPGLQIGTTSLLDYSFLIAGILLTFGGLIIWGLISIGFLAGLLPSLGYKMLNFGSLILLLGIGLMISEGYFRLRLRVIIGIGGVLMMLYSLIIAVPIIPILLFFFGLWSVIAAIGDL